MRSHSPKHIPFIPTWCMGVIQLSVGLIVVFSSINYAITGYGNSLWLGGCLKLIILFTCPSEYLPLIRHRNVQKKLRINFDLIYMHVHFSSPEPKAQVSFSEKNLSVVCRRKLFIVFSRTTGSNSNKPDIKHYWVKGIKFVQMKGHAIFKREDNLELLIF